KEWTMRTLIVALFGSLALTSLIPEARAGGDGIRVDVSKLGSPHTLYVYDKAHVALEREIAADSDDACLIGAWLKAHSDGWQATGFVSYAPSRYVRGKRFTLNFTTGGRHCILNYQEREGD